MDEDKSEARTLLIFALSLIVAIGLCFAFTWWQVTSSERHWCQALETLTQHPVSRPPDPKANPSREEGYVLYTEFVKIRGEFGCG